MRARVEKVDVLGWAKSYEWNKNGFVWFTSGVDHSNQEANMSTKPNPPPLLMGMGDSRFCCGVNILIWPIEDRICLDYTISLRNMDSTYWTHKQIILPQANVSATGKYYFEKKNLFLLSISLEKRKPNMTTGVTLTQVRSKNSNKHAWVGNLVIHGTVQGILPGFLGFVFSGKSLTQKINKEYKKLSKKIGRTVFFGIWYYVCIKRSGVNFVFRVTFMIS